MQFHCTPQDNILKSLESFPGSSMATEKNDDTPLPFTLQRGDIAKRARQPGSGAVCHCCTRISTHTAPRA